MTNTPEKIVYNRPRLRHRRPPGSRDPRRTASSTSASPPPRRSAGPGTGTNPEQLFAVGYGACFQGALTMVAKAHGVDASGSQLEIAVGFGPEATPTPSPPTSR